MYSLKSGNKLRLVILLSAYSLVLITIFSGCATVPREPMLTAYSIGGVSYISLTDLCTAKNISLDYDTVTGSAVLRKGIHRINVMAADDLVLVDGAPNSMAYPVRFYQGMLMVPHKFKEQFTDVVFKEYTPPKKTNLPMEGIKKVVIDAGHGGKDPGAIGRSGLREKDVVLDVARRLANILKSSGVEVVMTRSSDRYIELEARADVANNTEADLFISIHANANRVRSLNGFEIYYVGNDVDDYRRALWSAQHARLDFDKSSFSGSTLGLKTVLWDMIYTSGRAQSVELARAICRSVDRDLDTKVIGVKGARYYVLKGTRMPAVLIEIGFLSNSSEERLLKNNAYRQSIAEAIADGVEDYARSCALAYAER